MQFLSKGIIELIITTSPCINWFLFSCARDTNYDDDDGCSYMGETRSEKHSALISCGTSMQRCAVDGMTVMSYHCTLLPIDFNQHSPFSFVFST